jgi:hypothetical protein
VRPFEWGPLQREGQLLTLPQFRKVIETFEELELQVLLLLAMMQISGWLVLMGTDTSQCRPDGQGCRWAALSRG